MIPWRSQGDEAQTKCFRPRTRREFRASSRRLLFFRQTLRWADGWGRGKSGTGTARLKPSISGTIALDGAQVRSRALLADALRRVLAAGIELDGASDHGVSEALYLRNPENNGVELYCDRSTELWPRQADGSLEMITRTLDLNGLLSANCKGTVLVNLGMNYPHRPGC